MILFWFLDKLILFSFVVPLLFALPVARNCFTVEEAHVDTMRVFQLLLSKFMKGKWTVCAMNKTDKHKYWRRSTFYCRCRCCCIILHFCLDVCVIWLWVPVYLWHSIQRVMWMNYDNNAMYDCLNMLLLSTRDAKYITKIKILHL